MSEESIFVNDGACIRSVTAEDTEQLLGLIRELAEYERRLDEVTIDADTLHEALFSLHAAEAIMGFCDDEPVAYALFYPTFSTTTGRQGLYIEDIYVKPDHRGQGLGTLMMKALASAAEDRGCTAIAWCCISWTESAKEFYRRIGARQRDDLRVFHLEERAIRSLYGIPQ